MLGVWRIDDTDNSFSTQPFQIKYARQDVLLSMMVAFNMSLGNREVMTSDFFLSLSISRTHTHSHIQRHEHT